MNRQGEFIFAEGTAPEMHLPDPLGDFVSEVASLWSLPVGQKVRVELSGHQFVELHGRLELDRTPDLPLDVSRPLALRIGAIEFSSVQIRAWSLL